MPSLNVSSSPIIVRLPNWVGDACMCMPSIELLASTGRPLIICGRSWARGLTSQFRPRQFVALTGHFWSDLKAVRHISPSIRSNAQAIVFPDSLSSAALFALSGIKSAGYRDDGRTILLRWSFRKPSGNIHALKKWWLLTEQTLNRWSNTASNGSTEVKLPPLSITGSDKAAARAALESEHIGTEPFVLIAPTATGQHRGNVKVWPHFHELSTRLKQAGYRVVSCPPSSERQAAKSTAPEATLVGPLELMPFCALTTMAALVVCNDSGVSHLAALSGARQLSLFGVTDPEQTGPWSESALTMGQMGKWPELDEVYETCVRLLSSTNSATNLNKPCKSG